MMTPKANLDKARAKVDNFQEHVDDWRKGVDNLDSALALFKETGPLNGENCIPYARGKKELDEAHSWLCKARRIAVYGWKASLVDLKEAEAELARAEFDWLGHDGHGCLKGAVK